MSRPRRSAAGAAPARLLRAASRRRRRRRSSRPAQGSSASRRRRTRGRRRRDDREQQKKQAPAHQGDGSPAACGPRVTGMQAGRGTVLIAVVAALVLGVGAGVVLDRTRSKPQPVVLPVSQWSSAVDGTKVVAGSLAADPKRGVVLFEDRRLEPSLYSMPTRVRPAPPRLLDRKQLGARVSAGRPGRASTGRRPGVLVRGARPAARPCAPPPADETGARRPDHVRAEARQGRAARRRTQSLHLPGLRLSRRLLAAGGQARHGRARATAPRARTTACTGSIERREGSSPSGDRSSERRRRSRSRRAARRGRPQRDASSPAPTRSS